VLTEIPNLKSVSKAMMQTGLQAGGWTVPPYGLVAAAALVCGVLLAMRCARRLGLATDRFWNLILLTILGVLAGSRVQFAAERWSVVTHEPHYLLSGSGWNWGGAATGIIVAVLYLRRLARAGKPLPLMRVLDALAAPGLLVLGMLEIATAIALWRIWDDAAIFCALHLAVCAAFVAWVEWEKGLSLRAGELFGAALYIVALSLFIELESFILSLSHTFIMDMSAATDVVWVTAFLVVIAGALWTDWAATSKSAPAAVEMNTDAI
jgi:hypothetical protein